MGIFVPIFLSILLTIAFVVYLIIMSHLSSKEKKLVSRPNMPFIEIHSELRKAIIGYGRGVVEKQDPKPNGTTLFKIYPDDVLQGEGVKRPDFKEIIVHNDYIKRYSEGEIYPKRQLIKILPFSKMDMPEKIAETLEGESLDKEGQKAFAKKILGRNLINYQDAMIEASKEFAFGETSKADQRRLKDLAKKEKQIMGIDEVEKK